MFANDPSHHRVVDLSREVAPPGTGDPLFVIERGLPTDNAYEHDVLATHTHVGTHVETRAHFFDGARGITDYSLSAFFGRGILLEIYDAQTRQAILPPTEAAEWLRAHQIKMLGIDG